MVFLFYPQPESYINWYAIFKLIYQLDFKTFHVLNGIKKSTKVANILENNFLTIS